jgi:predicted SnoaL-like aldol condensation-catalyzing enzyme
MPLTAPTSGFSLPPMDPKEAAVTFLEMAGTGNARAAYDRFIAPHFKHHNVHFPGDRQSLLNAMEEAHRRSPNHSVDVRRVYRDGNTVITHSLVTRQNPAEPAIAVVHIFRFEGEKVAELWDLGMPLPSESPNLNGPI